MHPISSLHNTTLLRLLFILSFPSKPNNAYTESRSRPCHTFRFFRLSDAYVWESPTYFKIATMISKATLSPFENTRVFARRTADEGSNNFVCRGNSKKVAKTWNNNFKYLALYIITRKNVLLGNINDFQVHVTINRTLLILNLIDISFFEGDVIIVSFVIGTLPRGKKIKYPTIKKEEKKEKEKKGIVVRIRVPARMESVVRKKKINSIELLDRIECHQK